MKLNSLETEELLRCAAAGDDGAIRGLFARHRGRLRGIVASRLDRRVAARLDPSDVVQEALGEASQKFGGFVREQPVPFYSWLRRLTLLHLSWSHRFHLGSRKRSAAREVRLTAASTDEGSGAPCHALAGTGTSPSEHVVRDEECEQVRAVLDQLESSDRTFIELRYFERLSLAEIADRLGIGASAVKMRHVRALNRCRRLLEATSEGPSRERM